MKQAACGGTGCAVLNGKTFLQTHWAALGGLDREGLVPVDSEAADLSLRKGMWLGKIS